MLLNLQSSTLRRIVTRCMLCAALALLLIGCTAGGGRLPAPMRQTTVYGSHGTAELTDASLATWRADFDRVNDDVGRTIRDLGWGSLSIRTLEAGGQAGSQDGPTRHAVNDGVTIPLDTPLLVARALTPDGRSVSIRIWPAPDDADQITAAVRVGHFGDTRQERLFIVTLGRLLAGPPKPQRDAGFELPD